MTAKFDTSKLKKIKVDVTSSIIEYLEYSYNEYVLNIKFKRGRHRGKVRSYDETTPQESFELLNEPSVGKAVLKMLDARKAS